MLVSLNPLLLAAFQQVWSSSLFHMTKNRIAEDSHGSDKRSFKPTSLRGHLFDSTSDAYKDFQLDRKIE